MRRKVLLFVRRLFVAAAAAILVAVSSHSVITVESNGRTHQQQIRPFQKQETYEDSSLFQDILREEVRGLTRMVVIKSQLETDGAYNGQKKIDITQYAHRQEDLLEKNPTAEFYLDDLIKWGNYGFVTEKVYATEDELNSYFANGTSTFSMQNELAAGDWKKQSEKTRSILKQLTDKQGQTLSMRMISELPESREEYLLMAEELGKYVEPEDVWELDILVPRYLSAQGQDLAQYAADIEEYMQLREDLKTTSQELFYNFTEYSGNKDFYGADTSNLRYCFLLTEDGSPCYFTNLPEELTGKSQEEIGDIFRGFGRYLYYNADRAEIETNTEMSADMMKQEMGYYQYAFGDNTRVWIGVDTTYPAQDGFFLARETFNGVVPYVGYLTFAIVLFTALSLYLFLLLTKREGYVLTPEGDRQVVLQRADRIFTEPFVLLGLLVMAAFAAGCGTVLPLMQEWEEAAKSMWFPFAAGAAVFLMDYAGMFFYLSLVRRWKAHTLWQNSLILLAGRKLRSWALELYDNSHILLRSLVPFIVLLVLNLILGDLGVAGILVAAALDVAAILLLYYDKKSLQEIVEGTKRIGKGDFSYKIGADRMHGENRELAEAVNSIGDGIQTAVERSMKDERLKADLITNVSHDIKTPLTSIINFVNLLKREKIQDERIRGYIDVLDGKSQRLKQLTDDLVEASKITSGNISLQMERLNFAELVNQTCGEFADKFKEKCLETVTAMPEKPVYILADSRRIWRVVENLFSNTYKYALEGTRVYLEIKEVVQGGRKTAVFSMKNISAQALNIRAEELTERFIRGDISRSTEGSGLGLSIAKNLTELQKGSFEIYLDGDLFKVVITFPCLEEKGDGTHAE